MSEVFVALVHHPVLDRQGHVITTALTSIDLHDMARAAKTYGVEKLFIVHPVAAQRELAERVKAHWVHGSGARRIPTREAALAILEIVPSLEDAYEKLGGREAVEVYTTAARAEGVRSSDYPEARERIAQGEKKALLLFGTGWGLARSLLDEADVRLAPIRGTGSEYNHLSVRAACAIVLDRLLGEAGA